MNHRSLARIVGQVANLPALDERLRTPSMSESTPLPSVPAVQMGDTALSLRDVLLREHHHGRLLPWLRRVALGAFLVDQARALELKAEIGEKKLAADLFRRRRGLQSEDRFQDWLRRRRMRAADFDGVQERVLLLAKLRRQVMSRDKIDERFKADTGAHDRLRLRRIVVAREEQAREVIGQLKERGADFAALARRYSRAPRSFRVGRGSMIFRCQLPPPVRDAVAGATAGTVVGPIRSPAGFEVLRIDEVISARLDGPTGALIAARLFADWVRERRKEAPLKASLLDWMAPHE